MYLKLLKSVAVTAYLQSGLFFNILSASRRKSDNKIYAVGIDALSQLKGDNVVLYYTGDNIASAKPVTVVWFYVVMYMAWIAILIFLIFAAWKKFHGSHHAVEHTGKSRFDD